MTQYNKITALYSRLSVGDEDRDGGESNSIVNQKAFLERYARQEKLPNIRHYIDDDESGRFFDRSAYVRMMDDVESGKIGIVVMKDMTRWGRDYLQVGKLIQEQKQQERKDRTKRLCKRMGLFESMLPESISLTDEQFQIFLEKTIAAEHSRRILDGLTAQRSVQTSARGTAYTEAQDEADEDE